MTSEKMVNIGTLLAFVIVCHRSDDSAKDESRPGAAFPYPLGPRSFRFSASSSMAT